MVETLAVRLRNSVRTLTLLVFLQCYHIYTFVNYPEAKDLGDFLPISFKPYLSGFDG